MATTVVFSKTLSVLLFLFVNLRLSYSISLPSIDNSWHTFNKRALVVPDPPAAGWTSMGCYTEATGKRALHEGGYVSNNAMSIENCIAYCAARNYVYAGVEYSAECFCGNLIQDGSAPAPATDCSMACSGAPNEPCGGPGRLNMFKSSAPPPAGPVVNPGPPGWGSVGCYSEGTTGRALSVGMGTPGGGGALTVQLCTSACANANFKYAGVEYAGECYCGNSIINGGALATSGCDMLCNGNKTEYCGGGNRLNMYLQGATPPAASSSGPVASSSSVAPVASSSSVAPVASSSSVAPVASSSSAPATSASAAASGWTSQGCYAEGTTGRALPNGVQVPGLMTVEGCQAACKAKGYILAGVEYAQECWCANAVVNGGGPAPDGNAQCNMPCKGDATEMCGGPNRLNLYRYGVPAASSSASSAPSSSIVASSSVVASSATSSMPATSSAAASGWNSLGCYAEGTTGRALPMNIGVDALTVEKCQAACKNAGYILAGVEYAGECWCANAVVNGGGPAPDGNTQCNMPCKGDPTQICGGPNRLNLYRYGAPPTSSSASSVSSVIPSSSSSAPAVSSSSAAPVTGWQYGGCYKDDSPQGRILVDARPESNTMTIDKCIAACTAAGYTIAGLEYSSQCFCGPKLRFGAPIAPEADCGMACSGDATKKCGGPNRMSIYYTGTLAVEQPPAPQQGGLDSWKYIGCVKDLINDKYVLANQIIDQEKMTPKMCLDLCGKYGFGAGGIEYGYECFCGDPIDTPQIMPEGDCSITCPGNSSSLCGGGARLTYYEWTGQPFATFNYPTGAAAGEYKFLIPGVTVPLMTTVMKNGKIMFLEKFGTGAPNGTGAYEFDPFYDNNFGKAWRELIGLKTDVFCSAGLVLPDKVGRIMTIGGWSAESLSGVRFFTPDSAPGVNGTNQWEEDQKLVSLQAGRWYPSSMMMANGTILVIGGEIGANDVGENSLELLPRVGPKLPLPWLVPSEQINLYPFLAVLPGGGIFIAYYNEARILDPVTFNTVKVLDNMPAGITNPKGGRTYPYEGTMMIMPQAAPYTDALRVLVCGGSTPGNGYGIDNCVSIAPEDATDQWLIERMPSRRVLTCMVALPDGTYLILNGATQGVAGFGLASDPNLNAVLYDPSKPKNARMSVMANTTIPRMYHSEAVLMPDGRVLVSGSNPQDPKYPDEHRVEVFIPPYLKSGAARPSYKLVGTNSVPYGGTFQIQITSGVASKISLMGSESSTHGATFGQRTYFPAFSCAGQICTVTVPPNANICPPGWFQVYVLDNGTPSVASEFIRIGGDPGNLGTWPNQPGFTLPGV